VGDTASGPTFDPVYTAMIGRCPASDSKITIIVGFQGFRIPIKNGKFNLTLNGLTTRFTWSGTVASSGASGTESHQLAAFDSQGGLQDCATGSLSWTAQPVASGASKAAAPRTAYNVTITKASDGAVSYTVTN
jgi:hypothetical protein